MSMLKIVSVLIGIGLASAIIAIRLKASQHPTNAKKIILPPFFMSTGFLMFTAPFTRVPWSEFFEAFGVGVFFSLLLIITSKFEVRGRDIYLKRSKAFVFILVILVIIRTIMKIYFEQSITVPQLSGLFFTLAFGMIVPWRIAMYIMYRRLEKQMTVYQRV